MSDYYSRKDFLSFLPKEYKDTFKDDSFKGLNDVWLPMMFKMNFKGGWIAPTGLYYRITVKDKFQEIRSKCSFKATPASIFEHGYVLQEYSQPINNGIFSLRNDRKVLSFTLNKDALRNIRIFLNIMGIAKFYDYVMGHKILFELRFVETGTDNKPHIIKKYNNIFTTSQLLLILTKYRY